MTSKELCQRTGWHKSQVSRWAKQLGFGRREQGRLLFTRAEMMCLVWLSRATRPGNPHLRRGAK